MNVCGKCKARFPGFTALRDHFRTNHRREFIAICLWLGPEAGKPRSEDWWYYELKLERMQLNEKQEVRMVG